LDRVERQILYILSVTFTAKILYFLSVSEQEHFRGNIFIVGGIFWGGGGTLGKVKGLIILF
jgi:hypothetical protein